MTGKVGGAGRGQAVFTGGSGEQEEATVRHSATGDSMSRYPLKRGTRGLCFACSFILGWGLGISKSSSHKLERFSKLWVNITCFPNFKSYFCFIFPKTPLTYYLISLLQWSISTCYISTVNYIYQVRDVRIISDRNSRRCKGIAYIEFFEEDSVPPALKLSGTKIMGIPIQVQHTQVPITSEIMLCEIWSINEFNVWITMFLL